MVAPPWTPAPIVCVCVCVSLSLSISFFCALLTRTGDIREGASRRQTLFLARGLRLGILLLRLGQHASDPLRLDAGKGTKEGLQCNRNTLHTASDYISPIASTDHPTAYRASHASLLQPNGRSGLAALHK